LALGTFWATFDGFGCAEDCPDFSCGYRSKRTRPMVAYRLAAWQLARKVTAPDD
jgi:hypothetical protein